jgi:hypothetical protein
VNPVIPGGFAARIESTGAAPPAVEYRWDADTDILTATLSVRAAGDGASGSVEMEGTDGSWVIFDVHAGHIAGVEVAVWPEVRKVRTLALPADVVSGRVAIPVRDAAPGVAALEVDTLLAADADAEEKTIHFRFGTARPSRAVRIAQDLVLEIDARDGIAGVWLLNVPPFPGDQ